MSQASNTLKSYFKAQADFALALLKDDKNLEEIAGKVLVSLDGTNFKTIAEIFKSFEDSTTWNNQIYEAYCWGLENKVKEFKAGNKGTPFIGLALESFAKCKGFTLNTSYEDMQKAVLDAASSLYEV